MPKTSDLVTTGLSNESFLLLGEPGSGKTNFLRHMPKPMYVFDFDNGIKTLAGVEGIEYDVYKDAPPKYNGKLSDGVYKWGEGWVAARKKIDELTALFAQGKGPKVVALDSLTGMMELIKDAVMRESPGKQGIDIMEIQHWGGLLTQARYVLDTFTTWPCIKVAIGHIKRDENPLTNAVELVPLLQGQSQGTVPSYFDEIYFCDVVTKTDPKLGKTRSYVLTTQKNGFVKAARSRRNILDGTLNDWREVEKQLIGKA